MNFATEAAMREALAEVGTRALLVIPGYEGKLTFTPVHSGQSVVNLSTELLDHLDGYPHPLEFFEALRDYCAGRIAATTEARRTGGFVIPRGRARWEIAHAPAFQPLEVR